MSIMKKRFSNEEIVEVEMLLDGTYYDELPNAEFFIDEETRKENRIKEAKRNMDIRYYEEYENKHFENDISIQKAEWVVLLMNGDTETHYVNPVISAAKFSTKHEAMECVRKLVNELILKYDNLYVDERTDFKDTCTYRLEGNQSFIVHAKAVYGRIDV